MRAIGLVLAAAVWLVSSAVALAATITVTTGADDVANPPAGGIRDAVAKAQPGDTIQVGPGVNVTLAGDLEVPAGKNLAIEGAAPKGQRLQTTVTQSDPAPAQAPKLIVKGNGTTIHDLKFVGVEVAVRQAGATISSCEFDGRDKTDGVTIEGGNGVSVGTADESNTFKDCPTAVKSKDSSSVTVTNNAISKGTTGIRSTDDTNVAISGNKVSGDTCISVEGSQGKVDKNVLTPDKKGGTGVKVRPSAGGGSKGRLVLEKNQSKLKGTASGDDLKGRTDVDVISCAYDGKTKGAGCTVGMGGSSGSGFSVIGCTFTDCLVGLDCTDEGAVAPVCTVGDNRFDRCGEAFSLDCGDDGSCTVTGSDFSRCGTPTGRAMSVRSNGATVACDDSVFDHIKGDCIEVATGSTLCDLGTVTVTGCTGDVVDCEAGATATVDDVTSTGVKGADGFVEVDGCLFMPPALLDAEVLKAKTAPALDAAPRGNGCPLVTTVLDPAGNLTVTVDARYKAFAYVWISGGPDPARAVKKSMSNGTVTLTPAELPRDTVLRVCVAQFGQGGPTSDRFVGDASVRRSLGTIPSGPSPLTVSKTNFKLSASAGQEASDTFIITNHGNTPQNLTVPQVFGEFFVGPFGVITIQPLESKVFTVGFSSFKAGNYVVTIPILLEVGGTITIKAKGTATK